MAKNRNQSKKLPVAPVAVADFIDPKQLTAEETAAIVRNDELRTARGILTACMGGRAVAKDGKLAGSDLVGRCLRACKLVDGKTFVSVDQVAAACRKADKVEILKTIESHIASLVDNKANKARIELFRTFIAADGLSHLANALDTFIKYAAWQYGEKVVLGNGSTLNHSVDVRAEVTNMFGIRLTTGRRAKFGSFIS